MNSRVRIRLAVMMFLQYFIAGAFTPIISLYLKDQLHFTGMQVGVILSATAVGSIASPLIVSCIADRLVRAEQLLGILQLAGGAVLVAFALQHSFLPVLVLYFLYTLINAPTFALTNAVIFHHAGSQRHKFGSLRVWGTIGWIVVAWVFSFIWLRQGGAGVATSRLGGGLFLAAFVSFALGLYALTFPGTRALNRNAAIFPTDAFKVIMNPPVLRLLIFILIASFFYRFYFFGTAPFLRSIGIADRNIMPMMSLGQIPEVFAMGILGWLLLRFGSKKIIMIGLALDGFRYVTAAAGGPGWFVILGLVVHGLSYTLIYVTASIYLDRFCDANSRSGVHQLFNMLTSGGLGSFAGSLFCGAVMDACMTGGRVNYHLFWLVPVAGVSLLLVSMPIGLRLLPALRPQNRDEAAPMVEDATEES